MNNEFNIQKQFYRIYRGYITVSEFEEWLYKTKEIESIYGSNFYFDLLDLNYRKKYIKNELLNLIETKIPFYAFEQERIMSLLESIRKE